MRRPTSAAVLFGLALASAALAGCVGSGDLVPSEADASGPGSPDDPGNATNATPEEHAPGWPSLEEATIRPGVNVVDGSCTSNFLFRNPDNRTLYLGTAAHCVDDKELGEDVVVAGGEATGTLAYSSFEAMNSSEGAFGGERYENGANDFALVELPDEARDLVHPAMFSFGGPTGIATDVSQGDKVLAHGNSTLRPDPHPGYAAPREGYVTHHDEWTTGMYFVGPGVFGDSGSPVLTADGKALGDLVTLEIAPQPASNNAANLAATLDYANAHSNRTFELVTHPMDGSGTLPSASGTS